MEPPPAGEKGRTVDYFDGMTEYDDRYEYGDDWDWDQSDPRQYCEHGTFVGSWWGPDLMCPRCEMGDDPTPATDDATDDGEEVLL